MTRELAFIVPGRPSPKARARVVRGHSFTPKPTQLAEAKVLECFLAARPNMTPLTVPLAVHVTAAFDVPASWSKKRRAAAFGAPMPSRPDADNIAKLVTDALNGMLYADDAQICALTVTKRYAREDEGEPARLIVRASWEELP